MNHPSDLRRDPQPAVRADQHGDVVRDARKPTSRNIGRRKQPRAWPSVGHIRDLAHDLARHVFALSGPADDDATAERINRIAEEPSQA